MAKKPRTFTTLPNTVIADTRLTALDIRCLAVIALHDGRSLVTGSGAGCYAKSATLAELVRTDTTNFSKSLSKLIRAGYITREPQLMNKRRFTLRVVYPEDDSWRTDQQSDGPKVGEATNDVAETVGEAANDRTKSVGEGEGRNGSFSKQNSQHYISLNEEIDFEESKEIDSAEAAQFAGSDLRDEGGEWIKELRRSVRKNDAEASAVRGVSLQSLLGRNWTKLDTPAQLVRFETAFAGLDRDAMRIAEKECVHWEQFLFEAMDKYAGEPAGHQAERLLEEFSASYRAADERRSAKERAW